MSNKTQLQTNNTALDGYIARINSAKEVAASLPEVGSGSGGGSVETVTVSFYASMPDPGSMIHYIDNTMTLQSEEIQSGGAYIVAKGSIFVTDGLTVSGSDTGLSNCTKICGNSVCAAFLATG